MDMRTSFLALKHTGRPFNEVTAHSSLDSALNYSNKWSLEELSTFTGEDDSTCAEARLWVSRGKVLCNMTQQSIQRPKLGKGEANS